MLRRKMKMEITKSKFEKYIIYGKVDSARFISKFKTKQTDIKGKIY